MTQPVSTTKKLYLQDSYKETFSAQVLACDSDPRGGFVVRLDQTCLYPESGGQLADTGYLNGVAVEDVWEDETGSVFHRVAEKISPGAVAGQVDFARRFDHMQQHTGQHVLSRAFIEVGGRETISFHMGKDDCSIDLNNEATADEIRAAEELANNIVLENRDVHVRFVTRDELDREALRKKLPDGVTEVRLVEIDGFDVIGCCGTHVRKTGELGVVKILRIERVKGTNRVYFKVGRRALSDFQKKHEIVSTLARQFTTSVDDLADKVGKINSEGQLFRKTAQRMTKRLAGLEAERLFSEAKEFDGRRVVISVSDENEDFLKMLSSELRTKPKTISLLGLTSGSIVCCASKDVPIDLCDLVTGRAKRAGGSGGGKGSFATCKLPESTDVRQFLQQVLDDIS